MIKWKKITQYFVALTMMATAFPVTPLAVSASSGAELALAPIYPDNQRGHTGTFDLKMSPNQKQTIFLKVVNFSDEDKDVTVKIATAFTSDAGQVTINNPALPEENNLKVKFANLVKKSDRDKVVTLKANTATEVPITIKTPKKQFKGLVMGGVSVAPVNVENPLKHRGVGFRQQYSYAMPIILKEEEAPAVPKLRLGDIKPGRIANHIKIQATIKNINPALIASMSIDSKISKKSSSKVLGITHAKGLSMAPNSSFKFTNDWTNKKIYPGKYHYKAIARDSHGHKWLLEKDFTISIPDAFVHNANYDPMYKYYIFAAILLLLLLMALWIWLYTKRKKKKEEAQNEQQ